MPISTRFTITRNLLQTNANQSIVVQRLPRTSIRISSGILPRLPDEATTSIPGRQMQPGSVSRRWLLGKTGPGPAPCPPRPGPTTTRRRSRPTRRPVRSPAPTGAADDGTREPAVSVSLLRSPPPFDAGRDSPVRSDGRSGSCKCPAPREFNPRPRLPGGNVSIPIFFRAELDSISASNFNPVHNPTNLLLPCRSRAGSCTRSPKNRNWRGSWPASLPVVASGGGVAPLSSARSFLQGPKFSTSANTTVGRLHHWTRGSRFIRRRDGRRGHTRRCRSARD